MKRQLFTMLLGFTAIQAAAQLKVGANPQSISSGAVLQADASGTRGAFYLPRVMLTSNTDITTVASPQAGFTVYNTATAGVAPANVTPGYYYYDGSQWIKLLGSSSGADKNIYDGDGVLAGNRLVTQGASTLAFTASTANAFSIDGSTFSVDAASHRIGIGTVTPEFNLDINGTARITSLPAYVFGGTDAVLAIDPTTSQLKQFNFNKYGCPGCAVHEDLTTHIIPNGVTAYYDYDGNYTGTLVLPAVGRYIGDIFTYDHLATLGSTIKSSNTSMLSDLVMSPAGTGASFIWNGSKWMLISNSGASSSAGWSISGNTGTNYATNFLGTNDNKSLRIRTNNVQRAIIDSLGNAGIGTNAPVAKLDVVGSAIIGLDRLPGNPGSLWNAAPNVLNLLSPTAITTNVVAAPETVLRLMRPGSTGQTWAPTADIQIGRHSTISGSANTSLNFKLSNNGTPAPDFNVMTLLSNGNVGIGNTAPTVKMDVLGGAAIGIQRNPGDIGLSVDANILTAISPSQLTTNSAAVPETALRLVRAGSFNVKYNPSADFQLGSYGAGISAQTNLNIRLGNSTTQIPEADIMTLQANGNIGIGTTTPNSKLDLGSNLGDQKLAVWNNGAGTDFYGFGVQPGQLRFTVSSMVPSGVNTMILNNNGSVTMGNGATLTTGGVWTNASDIRLKKNIVAANYGLNEVMQLHPVHYEMKETGEPQVGFIAQEVRKIIPEVVFGKEGDMTKNETLSMSYGNLVPVLTKAIQEQQAQIDRLVAESAAMAQEIKEMKKMMHRK